MRCHESFKGYLFPSEKDAEGENMKYQKTNDTNPHAEKP